jgi:hypothetical protein
MEEQAQEVAIPAPGRFQRGGWLQPRADTADPGRRPSKLRAQERRVQAAAQQLTRAWLRELRR